jgi:hypothetical protein
MDRTSKPSMTLSYIVSPDDRELAARMVEVRSRTEPGKPSAEIEGALGEIAFARVFGLAVPEPVAKHGDGGIDYTLPSGATVDVKTISGPEPWRLGLLVPKRLRAGLYCLVHVDFDTGLVTLLGWQTGGASAQRGEDRGDHWRVKQRDLLPMTQLYHHVETPCDSSTGHGDDEP